MDARVNEFLARRSGLEGAFVLNVTKGTGAESAGLIPARQDDNGRIAIGDIIQKAAGRKVKNPDDVYSAMQKFRPGDEIELEILRDNQTMVVKVKLGRGE